MVIKYDLVDKKAFENPKLEILYVTIPRVKPAIVDIILVMQICMKILFQSHPQI